MRIQMRWQICSYTSCTWQWIEAEFIIVPTPFPFYSYRWWAKKVWARAHLPTLTREAWQGLPKAQAYRLWRQTEAPATLRSSPATNTSVTLVINWCITNYKNSSAGQDGDVGRYTLPPHTTKRRTTTNIKTKNNQNCRKLNCMEVWQPRN